ncbi:MAG: hypothetical protein K9L17_09725 [Clostridiales bacterium]|nr:hypothetical protein [Clostridiales bacterium]MCF8022958.1 hypothetical protein [Clostridiales bacterium]
MAPSVTIALTACLISLISAVLSRLIGKDKEMNSWSKEIKRCSELSIEAEKVGDRAMYSAFQKQGNEALHKYFAALYCEAVTELALHVLALGVFQHMYNQDVIRFGVNLWVLGDGIGVFFWYIIIAFTYHFAVFRRIKKRVPFFRSEI